MQEEAKGPALEVSVEVPISGEEAQEVQVKIPGEEVREKVAKSL